MLDLDLCIIFVCVWKAWILIFISIILIYHLIYENDFIYKFSKSNKWIIE